MTPFVHIQESPLDSESIREAAKDPKSGAVVIFEGCARDNHDGRAVAELSYEAYVPMALSQLQALRERAIAEFSLNACFIHHRLGTVPISEAAIVVACTSIHRAESFCAAAWLLDEIKKSVPIWKRELYLGEQDENAPQESQYSWVEGGK
jgi:molybdopterin synthase catalytic subunit